MTRAEIRQYLFRPRTVAQVAKKAGVKYQAAYQRLLAMEEAGEVRRDGFRHSVQTGCRTVLWRVVTGLRRSNKLTADQFDERVRQLIEARNVPVTEIISTTRADSRRVRRSLHRLGAVRRGDCWRLVTR